MDFKDGVWAIVFFVITGAVCAAAPEDIEKELSRIVPVDPSRPVPLIDFFRPPRIRSPELNPSGTRIAALVADGKDQTDLLVYDIGAQKAERLGGGDGVDIYALDWLNDASIVCGVGVSKHFAMGVYVADVGDALRLQSLNMEGKIAVPIGYPKGDSSEMVIWVRYDPEKLIGDGDIRKIQIGAAGKDSKKRPVKVVKRYPFPRTGAPMGFFTDRQGELAFALTDKDGVSRLNRWDGEKWETTPLDMEKTLLLAAGDVGEIVAAFSAEVGKPAALHRIDAKTGESLGILVSDERYDVSDVSIFRHPVDHRILGVSYPRKTLRTVWFDESYRELFQILEKAFPGETVVIAGSDQAQKRFLIHVTSDVRPPSYYLFSAPTGEVTKIMESAPWIDASRMQRMRTLTYRTRDGYELEGYLTLPREASKERPAPLVVMPHGGPWVRDQWGWQGDVQFLASRGYAVFQPNYRGSTSYAWKFPEQDHWDFPKMHGDVSDGVQAVLKTGLVDRDRIAIMGTSFGGYLSLCGAAYESETYRCAITIAGVFDWELMIKEVRGNDRYRNRYDRYRRYLGDPKKQREKFEEIAPLRRVKDIKIPVYVAHGLRDGVVSQEQSRRLVRELKENGVPFEQNLEFRDGHGFQHLVNQVKLHTEIEAFLAKHMAPRKAKEPDREGGKVVSK